MSTALPIMCFFSYLNCLRKLKKNWLYMDRHHFAVRVISVFMIFRFCCLYIKSNRWASTQGVSDHRRCALDSRNVLNNLKCKPTWTASPSKRHELGQHCLKSVAEQLLLVWEVRARGGQSSGFGKERYVVILNWANIFPTWFLAWSFTQSRHFERKWYPQWSPKVIC